MPLPPGWRADTPSARHAWPLIWLGMRVEADEATRCRDRREQVPEGTAQHCAELARTAAQLAIPAPPWRRYHALVCRRVRAGGRDRGGCRLVAGRRRVADTDEPYPLAYALLRLAEAHCAVGDPQSAARPVQQAHAIAERLGAAPIAAEAAALARRARLSLDLAIAPQQEPTLRQRRSRRMSWPGSGLPSASAKCCCCWLLAVPTRRSRRPCLSVPRPPACMCRTSWPSWVSAAGWKPRPCAPPRLRATVPGLTVAARSRFRSCSKRCCRDAKSGIGGERGRLRGSGADLRGRRRHSAAATRCAAPALSASVEAIR